MEKLIVQYKTSKEQRYITLFVACYFFITSLASVFYFIINKRFDVLFYLSLTGLLLSLIPIFLFTLWQPKPLISVDNEDITVNFPDQKLSGKISWDQISRINIGISHLKIHTEASKTYQIDLNELKYKDLREIKTIIIEFCEAKHIPYEND
ncbi:MAG: hypothetical protein LUG18_01825 [Candidatus Azobacteroides sp.]|nr:hypothetical protein [Candidatus Azobacteroides sp.]